MNIAFELVGDMPLLMHADDIEQADRLGVWRKDPSNKNVSSPGDDRSPAWTWQTYLYSDGEHLAMPSQNIMVALRQAGAQMIMKRQKTYKEITQSGMIIPGEYCDFLCRGKRISAVDLEAVANDPFEVQAETARTLGFRLFMKRAKVGAAKHIRVRPRFDVWSVRGEISVLVPELTFEIVERLFGLAGRVGLCDWRPGCRTPGPYGMFSAKLKKIA